MSDEAYIPGKDAPNVHGLTKTNDRKTPDSGAWCQPMDCGKHKPRHFIVRFEDADRSKDEAVFTDEAEAYEYFETANVAWNCWLFGAMPLRDRKQSGERETVFSEALRKSGKLRAVASIESGEAVGTEPLREAYEKVKLWPEKRMPGVDVSTLGEGFTDLLALRNAVAGYLSQPEQPAQWQIFWEGEWVNEDDNMIALRRTQGHTVRPLYTAPPPSPDVAALQAENELMRAVVGEVHRKLQWIAIARDDENADLDSLCTYAEQGLAALSRLDTEEPS